MPITGLKFDPQRGLGTNNTNTSVPTTAEEYYSPMQFTNPAEEFVEWALGNTPEEKKQEFDPMYSINKWNKGLEGLDDNERALWEDLNREKTFGKSPEWKDRLWRNQQFAQTFGEDAFYSIPNASDRDNVFMQLLTGQAIDKKFKDNSNYDQLQSLTPEGRITLLESDYQPDEAMRRRVAREDEKSWSDYTLGERWNAVANDAGSGAMMGMSALGTIGGIMGGGAGVFPGMIAGTVVGTLLGTVKGIADPQDGRRKNITKAESNNQEILDNIIRADNERKKEEAKDDIDSLTSQYIQAYANGQLSAEKADKMFDDLASHSTKEYIDEFGDVQKYDYQGSSYYNAFKDTDEFQHFNTYAKLKQVAQAQVLAQKYGQDSAMRVLDQDMQDYVHEAQSGWDWLGNTGKNIVVGGIANIMNKVIGLKALKEGFDGLVNDDNSLGEYLSREVKDTEGGYFKDIWENIMTPEYWEKVDQYNTLDATEIAKAEKNSGISRYSNIYAHGTENDFWSWSTLNEGLKMSKFAWSDYLTNVGLAKVVGGLTKLAGGVELSPGVLATESTLPSKIINKAGAIGIMGSSSLGIDVAYGMQTFNEVLEKNNQKLDAIIQKEVEAEVDKRIANEEAMQEFRQLVDTENARRAAAAGERGSYVPVDEDAAFSAYVGRIRSQVQQEQEQLHAQDRAQALEDAAQAYAIDASVEAVRMSTTNGLFKSYLFDKGTLAALRGNNPYVNTTFRDGAYALGRHATTKKAAGILANNVWGGFQSNYFDDITVGLAKGYGLQDYNNYLLTKYNPAAYGTVLDDYVLPFVAAMEGASEAALEKRAFLDGAVGAIGTVFSVSPTFHTHREMAKNALERAKQDKEAGITGIDHTPSGIEYVASYINNPVLEAIANAKAASRSTQYRIKAANDILKEHGDSFESMEEALVAMNQKQQKREGTSLLEAKDAKDKEAFTLATALIDLKNNEANTNAQAEPDKASWSKKKKASHAVMEGLKAALGISSEAPITPYAKAMLTLDDASKLDEEATDEEQAARQEEMVKTFLGMDINKNAIKGMSEEEQRAYARATLKENADNLLDIIDKTEKIQQKFSKSVFASQFSPGVAKQLMYQYALDGRIKSRLSGTEKLVSGEEVAVEDINEWLSKKQKERNSSNGLIAKYGSMKGYERTVAAQERRVQEAEEALAKAKQNEKKEDNPALSIMANAKLKASRTVIRKQAESTLAKQKAVLEKTKNEETPLKEILEGETPVISASDILKLHADDRLRLLDDYYRSDYSQAQQEEIDKAKALLTQDGTTLNDAMQNVKDAAELAHRVEDNMAAATRIMKDPLGASLLQDALESNRRKRIVDYFNDKVVTEATNDLIKNTRGYLGSENEIGKIAEKAKEVPMPILQGISKALKKEMSAMKKELGLPDITLDTLKDGVDQAIKEKQSQRKQFSEVEDYLRITSKVDHTEETPEQIVRNPETDEQVGVIPATRKTISRDLSKNDRSLLTRAVDYAAEKGMTVDELFEKGVPDDFMEYVSQINHSVDAAGKTLALSDQTNPVSREYMQGLLSDIREGYEKYKVNQEESKKKKETSANDASVATTPVGITVPGTAPATATPNVFNERAKKAEADSKEVLNKAAIANDKLTEGINTLLEVIDERGMSIEDSTALKNIIGELLSSEAFDDITALQKAIYKEVENRAIEGPIKTTALALRNLDVNKRINDKKNVAKGTAPTKRTEPEAGSKTEKLPPLTHLVSRTLSTFLFNPIWNKYITDHKMIEVINTLSKLYNEEQNEERGIKDGVLHNARVVFIFDPTLESETSESMKKGEYDRKEHAPIIMALEIKANTDEEFANNEIVKKLGLTKDSLIKLHSRPNGNWGWYYQPIGIMPGSTVKTEDTEAIQSTSKAMAIIRGNLKDAKGPVLVRPLTSENKEGTPYHSKISGVVQKTLSLNAETPIRDVHTLIEENANSENPIVPITESQKEKYEDAKRTNIPADVRKTNLYIHTREAFIKRLKKAANSKGKSILKYFYNPKEDGSFSRIVLTKKISETRSRNNPEATIISLLKGSILPGAGNNIIEANSRFRRIYNKLNGISTNQPFGEIGKEIHKAISNNLLVLGFNSEDNVVITKQEDTGNIEAVILGENLMPLATLLFSEKNGTLEISEDNFASFLKNLILDKEGNPRVSTNDASYELVKWNVNYQDAETLNSEDKSISEKNRENARNNLIELYDDGIFEMQTEDLVPTNEGIKISVTGNGTNIGNSLKVSQEAQSKKVDVTNDKAAGDAEAPTGLVDGDSGKPIGPQQEPAPKPTSKAQRVIDTIRTKLLGRTLNAEETHYDIDGELWTRVTSIKYAMEEGGNSKRWAKTDAVSPALKIGSSFDAFGRDVFNDKEIDVNEYDNSTPENYTKVNDALNKFKLVLRNRGEYVVSTLVDGKSAEITTKGKLKVTSKNADGTTSEELVRVAGTVDLLTVDKDGKIHIYDFKTSKYDITEQSAIDSGYVKQLSMYAKFMEEELRTLGIEDAEVASISIIPVKVDKYPTNRDFRVQSDDSNQLQWKEKIAKEDAYEDFTGANFEVKDELPLTRLSDDKLTVYRKEMSEDDIKAIEGSIRDEAENPAKAAGITIETAAPEAAEETKPWNLADEARGYTQDNKPKRRRNNRNTNNTDTGAIIKPEGSVQEKIEERKNDCGGKK